MYILYTAMVCEILQVSRQRVSKLVKDGKIKAEWHEGRLKYDTDSVDAYKATRHVGRPKNGGRVE